MSKYYIHLSAVFIILLFSSIHDRGNAQAVTSPPSGDNNKSIVTQYIGALASVTITYNSPNVTGPNGEDRKGKIWGALVPYGFVDQGFGTSKSAPWRAGANENTTISFSHDVLIQNKPLKAGAYGFFVAPAETGPWTLIFSNNSTSWGSFFYDEKEDALRVTTEPKPTSYHEWLTYEFIDRQPDNATCALIWEDKIIPFTIKVPDMTRVYLDNMRHELRNSTGFSWQGWSSAAQYSLQNKINLEEALIWADKSISDPFFGQENFTTLKTKSQILDELGRKDEAIQVMNKAISHPSAGVFDIHQYGRQLLASGKKEEALKVFQINAKKHPNTWPVNVGLARGYSAAGNYKAALKYAKMAYEEAPDAANKENMKSSMAKLEKNQDMN